MNLTPLQKKIIRRAYDRQIPHVGSALSCLPLVEYAMKEKMEGRATHVILSKGHASQALRVVAEEYGLATPENPPMHPEWWEGEYVDWQTGSLGHGLACAVGIAYAQKVAGDTRPVIVIVGDGEMQEGICYEALSFANEHDIPLKVLVDWNGTGAFGKVTRHYSDNAQWYHTTKTLKSHYVPPTVEEYPWLIKE